MVSYLVAMFIAVTLIVFASLSTALIINRFEHINREKLYYYKRFGALYDELRTSKRVYMMYHPLFFINRSIVAFTLVYLSSNFFVQIWIIIIS